MTTVDRRGSCPATSYHVLPIARRSTYGYGYGYYALHARLLVGAGLLSHPLWPDGGVQLCVDVEVVQDAGVVEGSELRVFGQPASSTRKRSMHTLTIILPGKAGPSRHMVEPQSPLSNKVRR